MRLVPIIEGGRAQFARFTLPQAAKQLAEAHRQNQRWDCRVATNGEGHRLMTDPEAADLVAAIAKELT